MTNSAMAGMAVAGRIGITMIMAAGVAAGIEHSQGAYRSDESGDARRVTNADFCADF